MLRHLLPAMLLSIPMTLHATEAVRINARQSDEAVRQRLLELTPLGTQQRRLFGLHNRGFGGKVRLSAGLRGILESDLGISFTRS
jgi:hypothetical protein